MHLQYFELAILLLEKYPENTPPNTHTQKAWYMHIKGSSPIVGITSGKIFIKARKTYKISSYLLTSNLYILMGNISYIGETWQTLPYSSG